MSDIYNGNGVSEPNNKINGDNNNHLNVNANNVNNAKTIETNSSANDNIMFRVAKIDDHDEILDFIRTHYYPEEPLTVGNEPKLQSREDEEFSMSVLSHEMSVIAVDTLRDNRIVGALLAAPLGADEGNEMYEEAKLCPDKKWSEILELLAYLDTNACSHKRYNVHNVMHIHVMGVDRETRGKSIGIKLMKKSMEIGKTLGYQLVTVDCSSVYSIKIAEKLQMDCIVNLAYKDYKDINGKQLFRPPMPHTHIKTFAKLL